jgi:hypothetical protein
MHAGPLMPLLPMAKTLFVVALLFQPIPDLVVLALYLLCPLIFNLHHRRPLLAFLEETNKQEKRRKRTCPFYFLPVYLTDIRKSISFVFHNNCC